MLRNRSTSCGCDEMAPLQAEFFGENPGPTARDSGSRVRAPGILGLLHDADVAVKLARDFLVPSRRAVTRRGICDRRIPALGGTRGGSTSPFARAGLASRQRAPFRRPGPGRGGALAREASRGAVAARSSTCPGSRRCVSCECGNPRPDDRAHWRPSCIRASNPGFTLR